MNRLTSLLLSFFFFFFVTQLHAGAAEAWTIEEVVYNDIGKNLTYTASKTGAAANDYIYKAKVPVTAAATGSTVASMIRMGLAGAAIYGIVEGVGWIIDNGVVKKKENIDPDFQPYEFTCYFYGNKTHSLDSCATALYSRFGVSSHDCSSVNLSKLVIGQVLSCSYSYSDGSKQFYNTATVTKVDQPETKLVPVSDSELGEEVNKSPHAPELLPDIYNPNNPAGGAAPQKTADALDSAPPQPRTSPKTDIKKKPNSDTNGDGEPDVYDPSKPDLGSEFELPEFCSWAVTVCEWYKKYKDDSDLAKEHRLKQTEVWSKEELARQEEKQHRVDEKTFWEKVENWFDWTKEPPETPDPIDVPEKELEQKEIKKDLISVNVRSCPADIRFDVQDLPFGIQVNKAVQMQPICDTIEPLKYVFQLMTFVFCGFILLRV